MANASDCLPCSSCIDLSVNGLCWPLYWVFYNLLKYIIDLADFVA